MKAIVSSAILLTVVCGTAQSTMAQVVPDSTLGTQVTQTGAVFNINNGMRSGNNLFHSFSQFSVPTGGSAIFNNTTDIQNIFSRVTGSQLSNIDGILKNQGTTNLFLMNPNGITFGQNARLQLGGSFLGTTASGIKFADGIKFDTANTTTPASPALLSVNVPIGLQMGNNPSTIQVKGSGHRLAAPSASLAPYISTGSMAGLTVKPGKTLALVGGSINLVGAVLGAERGRVELASLGSDGTTALDISKPFWTLDIAATQKLSDIILSQGAIVDVSGAGAGSMQVQGRRISLTDGSLLFNQNRGPAVAGDIRVNADSLEIIGGIDNRNIRSAIVNETRSGNSGNIVVTVRQLNLVEGGAVFSRTFGLGSSGNIDINAIQSIKVTGYSVNNPELFSAIGSVSFSPLVSGRSGLITVSTPILSLKEGAIIAATTFGNAVAGNINIQADRIEIAGQSPSTFGSSAITSSTFGKGNAGSIGINTRSLLIRDLGTINTVSSNSGDAGSITINASESIKIMNGNSFRQSNIGSSITPAAANVMRALNLPPNPRGNAGSVIISVPVLDIRDYGRINVSNRALGNSGKITIKSDKIFLDRQAQINASTVVGEGGNVVLKSQALVLRQGSRITATAGISGNGGNITIDSPIIVGLENSDIIANASAGRGGNIAISTQGLLGLQYRTNLTPENDITASSEFGINGNVQVNTIGINPANSLNALPGNIVDSSRQMADRCNSSKTSSFIATGRGGIPQSPAKRNSTDRSWHDVRSLATTQPSMVQPALTSHSTEPIVEANAIQVDESGAIVLVTSSANALVATKPMEISAAATCSMGEGAIVKP